MTHMQRPDRREIRQASFPPQFWVVGGEFSDTGFNALAGPAEAHGPFIDYDEAFKDWERRSMEMKRHAHVRYTIVGNFIP